MTIETVKEINKLMETDQKPLTKHIQTAVNAIQKQIESYEKKVVKYQNNARLSLDAAETLQEEIAGLEEQISKLKGE